MYKDLYWKDKTVDSLLIFAKENHILIRWPFILRLSPGKFPSERASNGDKDSCN